MTPEQQAALDEAVTRASGINDSLTGVGRPERLNPRRTASGIPKRKNHHG